MHCSYLHVNPSHTIISMHILDTVPYNYLRCWQGAITTGRLCSCVFSSYHSLIITALLSILFTSTYNNPNMVYMVCKMGVNCNLNFHELCYLYCYIHFEIIGDPCDLIGSCQCINEKEFNCTWFKLFGTEILRSSVGPTPLGLFTPNFPLHLLLFLGLFCWLTGCFHWGVLVNLNIKNYVSDFFLTVIFGTW